MVADFSLPLSSRVICQVLGVPDRDRDRFGGWLSTFLSASSASADDRMRVLGEFLAYGAGLVAAHRKTPGHDLLDDLIQAHDDGDRLGEDELVNVLFMLITAGHETTALMIGRGVYRLLPGAGARPDGAAGGAERAGAAGAPAASRHSAGGGAVEHRGADPPARTAARPARMRAAVRTEVRCGP